MKNLILSCALLALSLMAVQAQDSVSYREKQPYKNWVRLARELPDPFFTTAEATRIADNVLLYQLNTGGWPKNIYMPAEITDVERDNVLRAKYDINQGTIDNNATTTEIRYLSRTYMATGLTQYRDGALEGIRYLLRAQYENGGWPQFWPLPMGYYTHITYNDNAMAGVMELLREVFEKQPPYTYVPDSICLQARQAFGKGVECILRTQVRQNGRLTVWCAQHDEHTLSPAKARAYELPSLSGAESIGILMLLMSIPNPSQEVKQSVEAGVAWFRENRICGLRRERFTNEQGKPDYRMVPCKEGDDCPTLWARFYTLDTNRPFCCDRDGQPRFDVSEIGYERRNGYSWYHTHGTELLQRYEEWKAQ